MDPLFQTSWELRELTISYRIPAAVADAAQAYARAARLPVSDLRAAREIADATGATRTDDPVETAAAVARRHAASFAGAEGGLVAVIAHERHLSALRARLSGTEVEVCTARESKGLEFDVAVVVEPAEIAARPGDLYVALTRPTKRLDIVHARPLPEGLAV
jgi:ATP-dependent exoDNAse (exonuclease V) beta subunit